MFVLATFFLTALTTVVAQAPPPQMPLPMPAQQPLESGACLDSARAVPQVLQPPPIRALQIVRIDEVVSTATMMPGGIVGFLYTTADGATWLGQRSSDYMSPADATAINGVLASTHVPEQNVTEFPPASRYGVATRYPRFFKVRIAPGAMQALRFRVVPCVAWPRGRALPDPVL
jgi:hypothetical protein